LSVDERNSCRCYRSVDDLLLPLLRAEFSWFNAPAYFVPNAFMYEVGNGRVDVANHHEAECDIDLSGEEIYYGEV